MVQKCKHRKHGHKKYEKKWRSCFPIWFMCIPILTLICPLFIVPAYRISVFRNSVLLFARYRQLRDYNYEAHNFPFKKKAFLPTVLSTELPFFIRGKVSGNVLPPTFSVKLVGSASYRAGGCINWVVFTLCREKMCSFSCGLTTSIPLGVCNANNSPYFSYGAPMWIIAVLARWRFFVPGSRKAGALTLNDSVWKNLLEVVLSHAGVHPQFYSVYAGRSVGATASDSRPGEVSNPGTCVHSSTLHIVLGTCLLCGTQDD